MVFVDTVYVDTCILTTVVPFKGHLQSMIQWSKEYGRVFG